MPTLYLLRHAKSDWSDRSLADHARPLAPRGRRAARAMGEYLAREGLLPGIVLCSTASRTRETWDLVRGQLESAPTVIFDDDLYGASAQEIVGIVGRLKSGSGPALVVGHNPGFENVASRLTGEGDPREIERMRRKYPTAALAVLECPGEGWDGLGDGSCTLERFVRPKDLPGAEERNL